MLRRDDALAKPVKALQRAHLILAEASHQIANGEYSLEFLEDADLILD